MKLLKVIAKNVYTFDDIEIDLTKFSLTQVWGENLDEKIIEDNEDKDVLANNGNGVGKTNLYNLIIQALYSKDLYKTKKQFLSNIHGTNSFYIRLDLEIEDVPSYIEYTHSSCVLVVGKENIINGRKQVTEFFENLMPSQLFIYLTYLSNVIYLPFFTATNKESQQLISIIFSELLDLKEKTNILKEAVKSSRDQKIKLSSTVSTLKDLTAKSPMPLKVLPNEPVKLFDNDRIVEINILIKSIKDFQSKNIELIKKRDELREKYKQVSLDLDSIDFGELIDRKTEISEQETKRSQLVGQVNLLHDDLPKVKKALQAQTCPTCRQDVNKDLLNDIIARREEDIRISKEKIAKLTDELISLVNNQKEFTELKRKKDKLQTEKTQALSQGTIIKEQLESLTPIENNVEKLTAELQTLQEMKTEYDSDYARYSIELKQAQEFNAYQKALKSQIEEAKEALQQAELDFQIEEKRFNILSLLFKVCSEDVLIAQIPSRLAVLEQFINNELSSYTSQFKVQLEMKNEKISRYILKNGKEFPYASLSSGEKTRVNLAVVFAVKNILKALKKEDVNIIFIDELLNTLDYSGRTRLMSEIDFPELNTFVVSHSTIDSTKPELKLLRKGNKTKVEFYGN